MLYRRAYMCFFHKLPLHIRCDGQRPDHVSGGSGCFSRAFCRENSQLEATVADVPAVVSLHLRNAYVEPFLRRRIRAVNADLFTATTWPSGHDTILLANVLHDWSIRECSAICESAWRALPPGGMIVVVEALLDEDRGGPLPAALYSVSMMLGDWRSGQQLCFGDLEGMLSDAKFKRIERGASVGPFHTAVLAYK